MLHSEMERHGSLEACEKPGWQLSRSLVAGRESVTGADQRKGHEPWHRLKCELSWMLNPLRTLKGQENELTARTLHGKTISSG